MGVAGDLYFILCTARYVGGGGDLYFLLCTARHIVGGSRDLYFIPCTVRDHVGIDACTYTSYLVLRAIAWTLVQVCILYYRHQ